MISRFDKVHRPLMQGVRLDLRDTRQLVGSDPRSRIVGLVFPVCGGAPDFCKVGRRPGGCRRAPFFGETLIHCRSARASLPRERSRGGGARAAVPHALRAVGVTCPGGLVTVIGKRGQALKGAWWMSWHREATKDVVACDKLREAGKRALIRRCPNEETQLGSHPVTPR